MPVDHQEHSADVIKEIGLYTQKILITLNAGGMLALLTFIGNIESNQTVIFDVEVIKLSLFAFLFGVIFVGLSLFVDYLHAQRAFSNPGQTGNSFAWFMIKMVGPVFLSLLAFCLGVWTAIEGISAP